MSVPKLVLQSEVATLEHLAASGSKEADAIVKILKAMPYGCSVSVGALTSGHRDVTIQLQTGEGTNLAASHLLPVWVSDTAGAGLTAQTTMTVTVQTGTLINTDTANKAYRVLTDTTGKAVIRVADTAKTYYVNTNVDGLVSSAAVAL